MNSRNDYRHFIIIRVARFIHRQRYVKYIDSNYNRLRYIYLNGQIVGLAALNTLYQRHFSYMSIRTVGGLSTFSGDSGMGLYMGYISTEGFLFTEKARQF